MWAALAAKARSPQRDVVILEAATVANGASGRNGGFVAYSLTHGLSNGLARFPEEMTTLERLGMENFAGMREDIRHHGIDCGWEETGTLATALEPHEEAWLREGAETAARYGHDVELLDREAVAERVRSPLFRSGLLSRDGHALVDPARLAMGLLEAALRAGVRVHEYSPVTGLHRGDRQPGVVATTNAGSLRAAKVLLATSAFAPLLGGLKRYIAPVYDYVVLTEPLSAAQRAEIGWTGREGLDDCANQFHYYRQSADHRIPFGGYDAVYRYGGPVSPYHDIDGETTFATPVPAFRDGVPPARGHPLLPPLGRRHRHLQPVLRVLRDGVPGTGRLWPRLHRARRLLHPLRSPRGARPAGRDHLGGDPAAVCAPPAGALPA